MLERNHMTIRLLVLGSLVASVAPAARAQEPSPKGGAAVAGGALADAGPSGPSRAEFNRLQAEVREQKQLLLDMLQAEQQRYDMVLKIIRSQGGGAALEGLPPLVPPAGADSAGGGRSSADRSERPKAAAVESVRRTAALEGKVEATDGRGMSEVYVYVENVKATNAKGKTIEIKQENKQFAPRLAVVQVGTSVVFPNFDAVYHNVFSNSPRNSFDLGSYRAGDKARSVTLTTPGVVEIFCNMHQKMTANVLVVPSPLFTKVRSDGTFRIENVPVGMRKIVAWSPGAKSTQQRVAVTASGADVRLALERDEARTHTNKLGQAYGSYRD
jgi:plastocyanin